MDTTPEVAAQVVALIESGLNQSQVARQLNLSRYSVRRVYQRYQATDGYQRRQGSGRPRATTERDNRFLMTMSLRNRRLNAVQLGQRLQEARRSQSVDSQKTIERRRPHCTQTSNRAETDPSPQTSPPSVRSGAFELDRGAMEDSPVL